MEKSKDGQLISDLEGRRGDSWSSLRSSSTEPPPSPPPPPDPLDIQPADSDLFIDCSAPTKEGIQDAIKQPKNGKATGPDNIPAEALMVDVRRNVELLYPLFNTIWEEERVPADWKEG